MITTRNVSSLLKELKSSEDLKAEFNHNPLRFLENVEDEAAINEVWVFIAIVGIVAAVLIASVITISILVTNQNAKVPEFLVAISSTALGAIVGLLVPTPGRR